MTTSRRLAAALLLFAVALPLQADFRAIARALDGHRGVKRVWMPGIGLARMLVWVVRPKGVHDFQIAVFEGADAIESRHLHALIESKMEPGFRPLVQVRSRKSGEWSYIYVRPRANSDRMEMMVMAHDHEDTVLIRVDVDMEIIARELSEPRNVHRVARR